MSKPLSRRSRDFFAGIPHIYSASPGSGRQESSYGPAPVILTRSEASVPTNGVRPGNPAATMVNSASSAVPLLGAGALALGAHVIASEARQSPPASMAWQGRVGPLRHTLLMCGWKKAFFAFRVPVGRSGLLERTALFDHLPAGTHKALNAMGPREDISAGMLLSYATYRHREASIYKSAAAGGSACLALPSRKIRSLDQNGSKRDRRTFGRRAFRLYEVPLFFVMFVTTLEGVVGSQSAVVGGRDKPNLFRRSACQTKPISIRRLGPRGQIMQNEPNVANRPGPRRAKCAKRTQFRRPQPRGGADRAKQSQT